MTYQRIRYYMLEDGTTETVIPAKDLKSARAQAYAIVSKHRIGYRAILWDGGMRFGTTFKKHEMEGTIANRRGGIEYTNARHGTKYRLESDGSITRVRCII